MERIHLLIQVAVLKVQKTKGVEVKVSTAFHFHLTHPVKPRAWSLLTTITLQVLFGDPAVLQNVPELHLWHISAFQRAVSHSPLAGAQGQPFWANTEGGCQGLLELPSPQAWTQCCSDLLASCFCSGAHNWEKNSSAQFNSLVVLKGSGVESHSHISWFSTQKSPLFPFLLCILESCLVHHSFP